MVLNTRRAAVNSIAALALTAGGVLLGGGSSATASSSPDSPSAAGQSTSGAVNTTIRTWVGGTGAKCLDDSFAFGLRVIPCNGTNWQNWSVGNPGPGLAMQNLETGRCVDDSPAYGLRTVPCNGLEYQFFWSRIVGGGEPGYSWRWLQNQNTRACMDYSVEYGLRGFPCNGTNWQNWYIREG